MSLADSPLDFPAFSFLMPDDDDVALFLALSVSHFFSLNNDDVALLLALLILRLFVPVDARRRRHGGSPCALGPAFSF